VSKYIKNDKLNPILWQCHKANLTQDALCKALGISKVTLRVWIKNPFCIQLKHIQVMAGIFGLSCEELVYILIRNKPQLITKGSTHGKWYIESIRDKHK
jgi:hypothetical protein